MQRVVVVGAGLGGSTLARELVRLGHPGPVTLVGEEQLAPYDRPPLSKQALRGEQSEPAWLEELPDGVDLVLGRRATGLRELTTTGGVQLDDGTTLPYDVLVLAPGAVPRPLPGPSLPGVHLLRTWDDAQALRADLLAHGELVVVGGGFIGCEVAASARELGASVTLVELLSGPLVRVLGPRLAQEMAARHEARGVVLRCGVGVAGVRGEARVEALELTDGTVLPARVVVVGLGVVPATDWLRGAVDLLSDGGIACDTAGLTSRPDVFALGDAASWGGRRLEHWTSAVDQAATVARALTGDAQPHVAVSYFWSDQHGSTLQGVGEVSPTTEVEVHQVGEGLVALHATGDALTGVVCLDARKLVGRARKLLAAGADLGQARARLLA